MSSKLIYYIVLILLNHCAFATVQSLNTHNAFKPSKYDSHNCKTSLSGMSCIKYEHLTTSKENFTSFYIDQNPITNLEYLKCVEQKGCKKIIGLKETNDFLALDFDSAYNFCKWQGKILPSFEQLLLAKQEANLQISNSEWTNTWAEECREDCKKIECSRICISSTNPCSGRYPCGKLDVKNVILSSGEKKQSSVSKKLENHFARCASWTPYLTKAPAWMIQNPVNTPETLPPKPTDEQLQIFHKLKEYDVLDKKFCSKPFLSPADCRDPVSYIKPNEARNYLFAPYIKNLRGGYVGVAADANYSYVSYAKSEWVFLMDFDFVILNLHKTIRAFVKESPNVKEFLEKWKPTNNQSISILEKYYKDSPDFSILKGLFLKNRAILFEHYQNISQPSKENGDFGWLRNPENYAYIRHLYLMERISIHGGDLLKDKTLYNIGEAAKQLGIKIRIFYPSNAEEFWEFSENYKRNILNLPFDEASVVLRTVHEYPWHVNDRSGGTLGFWHYVVHGAYNYQKYLQYPDYYHIQHFKNERILPTDMRDFSTIHLPHHIPEELRKVL